MALQSSSSDPNFELSCTDIQATLKLWEEKHTAPMFDPIPIVIRLAELFEEKNKMYIQRDPDPFDKSHPSSADPNCEFGRSLKLLFRKDTFTMKLVDDYLRDKSLMGHNVPRSAFDLNVAACRLILLIMPGLDITSVFKVEYYNLIKRFYSWANNHKEPLRSYATGILAAAMEVEDIANNSREQNMVLVPILMKRLHDLQCELIESQNINAEGHSSNSLYLKGDVHSSFNDGYSTTNRPFAHLGGIRNPTELNSRTNGASKFQITFDPSCVFPNDNSSQSFHDKKLERNAIPIYPPTIETIQMLTLRYLASIGQQQDFLGQVFEHNAMQIIFRYIENLEPNSSNLLFEALKYLSSLLCHKKFSLEFISQGGLERLLKVPRRSIAATGVSDAFYHLAYCEDAMELIFSMSPKLVSEVVKYTLCLLNCNHNSGRCNAIMFFGLTFQFKKILDEFDKQDGLRKLFNVVAVHPVSGNDRNLNELHVVVALKNYMESHLFFKYSELSSISTLRATKQTPEMISEKVRTLQELLSLRAHWQPVESILALELIPFLLQVVGYVYDWSCRYSSETVRAALDVLLICCAIPKVHLMLCESVNLQNDKSIDGINIILSAANGGNMNESEIQKAALTLLAHCVCSSTVKHVSFGAPLTPGIIASKRITTKHSEEISKKVWKSVRSNNGIFVLLQLLEIKTPITYADCIRALAMQTLAGLARSETVQQIIGKLPLFTNGQLESLTRDPILQEKRTEHVRFQKYAIELMERISGKPKSTKQIDSSLANIHKANVVAQTKIQFNEQQLFELIHVHLTERGMHETAATLQREANLTKKIVPNNSLVHPSTFPFKYPRTPKKTKTNSNLNVPSTTLTEPQSPTQSEHDAVTTKVKLVKRPHQNNSMNCSTEYIQQQQRSLQKQITATDCGGAIITSRLNPMEYSSSVTLDTIITEYLANQHSLCQNPMSTCPQFDLFEPHKCPDPRPKILNGVCLNFARRYHHRQAGYNSQYLDRRLVHSVMHATRVIKSEGSLFSCCDFKPYTTDIVVGLQYGEVVVYDIESNEKYSYPCHSTPINHVKCSKDGALLLTSSQSRSKMWNIEEKSFLMKLAFDEQKYVEFSKVDQDKVLGTNGKVATIYDVRNGKKIATFTPTIENQYTRNRATFCPSDDLILTDGVLFDVRSGKELHKFDKLNQTLSGVFHPNGLEVVSNTEVWDLRTFHLLRTVPALDQSVVTFSSQRVIYGRALLTKLDTKSFSESKFTTFKTLDSYDYSSIATFDVKRNICDLSVNKFGSYVALVEYSTNTDLTQDTVVRVYCVGEGKNDDNGDDDNNDMQDSTDSSSSSYGDESDASEWVPQRNGDVDMNNGTETEDMEEDQSSDHNNDDTDADNYSDV